MQMPLVASSEKHVVELQLKTNCSKVQTASAPEHHLRVSCRASSHANSQAYRGSAATSRWGSRQPPWTNPPLPQDQNMSMSKSLPRRTWETYQFPRPAPAACRHVPSLVSAREWWRLAADHPWEDPGCSIRASKSMTSISMTNNSRPRTKTYQFPRPAPTACKAGFR